MSWPYLSWELLLSVAVAFSTFSSFLLFMLPSSYSAYAEERVALDQFSLDDRNDPDSGFHYIQPSERDMDKGKAATSAVVFVLGDLGRSPRMQYHALSIAKYGGRVDLIGYVQSDVLPAIRDHKLIRVVALQPVPGTLQAGSKVLFPFIAPLKVLYQTWTIWQALAYRTYPRKYMLVQNPPSIPSLLVAQMVCMIRNTKLVVDWHNLGHTLLALKLGEKHGLVKASEAYDKSVARYAYKNLTVSDAMTRLLNREYKLEASTLHDRPAKQFRVISDDQRAVFLERLPETSAHAKQILSGKRRLLVSSTSWTADEDFSLLLDALVGYSAAAAGDPKLPQVTVVITGKGGMKAHYELRISQLRISDKLSNVDMHTAWLSMEDYATLLGAADLGVSLHTSSSGVDLPMKVVDMFGAGLPVVGWNKFQAWPELVDEGVNGLGFSSTEQLRRLLEDVFRDDGAKLKKLKEGALRESMRRWEDEWPKVADIFGLQT